MTGLGSLTLQQMESMGALRPDLSIFARRLLVSSYEDFVTVLYEDLDACIVRLEEDPGVRQEDEEDRLTAELINMLCMCGYDASHDEKVGGHSDIVVRHPQHYTWVGEAKIHGAYQHLMDGFNQLTTRYLQGTPNADQGALLVYIRNLDAAGVMKSWGDNVSALGLANYARQNCPVRKELGFYNTQTHAGSGRMVTIRHIGIKQHWKPVK